MDGLQKTVNAVSKLITMGLKPVPSLLGYSPFDIAGSLRLALVLRQLRDAERIKAQKLQSKLKGQSKNDRGLEDKSLVADLVTMMVVIYGGEMICSPWLQFTPSFLTMSRYPPLFATAQVFINILPIVPSMSIHTELPLSFFDGLTRAFLLTTSNPGFIIKHSSPQVASSPWALMVSSLILANGGFFLVNLFQMLSPYGWHVKTPAEFLPGGWSTMDLWVAPLITGVHALLTQSQTAWIPYHRYLVESVGSSTIFGTLEYVIAETGDKAGTTVKPMGEAEARSICALLLCALFAFRAIINFGIDQTHTTGTQPLKRKRVIRSKHDGQHLSREILEVSHKTG